MTDVTLRVGGRGYAGWKSVKITNGIESLAGSFDLAVSDRWKAGQNPWPIGEGDACEVLVGDLPVISGYVDRRGSSYDAQSHELTVAGRDRAAALVDCSAMLDSWEFKNVDLLSLATKLAQPFGVSVRMDGGISGRVSLSTGKQKNAVASKTGKLGGLGLPNPPAKFSIDPGESAFEALDKACRLAGVLPISDGKGGIILTRAGTGRASTALVEGENILSASSEFDATGRYHAYRVMAQHQQSKDWFGNTAAGVRGEATDEEEPREERVLLIRPASGMNAESAKQRAAWEAKVRASRGDTVTVRVQGWTQADGSLWPLNGVATVRSPLIGIDGDLVIVQRDLEIDDQSGTVTTLTLRRPDAFLPEPVIKTGGESGWKEIRKGV